MIDLVLDDPRKHACCPHTKLLPLGIHVLDLDGGWTYHFPVDPGNAEAPLVEGFPVPGSAYDAGIYHRHERPFILRLRVNDRYPFCYAEWDDNHK